ncbi:cytochrome c oxidase subunit II [Alteraurantiacibacter buctensis]|uniref:Cytochrome c oxidase subunit 2 n=1 Tax=Alteraurantiacibacter buctensis TaxID=1503981 RepID=A0A844YUN9_9SPHN|nr:cytochrome c oxidase subunit II [Alteraurantiacibacter buctensis]MXO71279.1 cytochrome c oxidase subunit II [Alteraurantiacibacter buctensis]
MIFGEFARKRLQILTLVAAALTMFAAPAASLAQESAAAPQPSAQAEAPVAATDAAPATEAPAAEAPAFQHYGADMIKGQPTDGALGFQDQYSPIGEEGLWMHDAILMPIITVISLFVLALLLWVIVRFNKRANPVASKTSHNTVIEVIWTVIPVLILLVIAVPSIRLLAAQYEAPPEDAITIKATGYQWYWGYTYVDNGGFEVISNMMSEADAAAGGFPHQLEVDNRMVVPVGVPLRIQTFGADVIHSFGIPSLWFKIDAVPGRINERMLTITEPGIYYGQCMELCGARHGYMPIAIEARPLDEYNAWVLSKGGSIAGAEEAAPAAAAPAAAAPAAEASAAPAPEASASAAPAA